MTNEQKEKVMLMRRQCYSYSEIADSVGVAKNTIKSFCQRNDLGERYVQNVKEKGSNVCPQKNVFGILEKMLSIVWRQGG